MIPSVRTLCQVMSAWGKGKQRCCMIWLFHFPMASFSWSLPWASNPLTNPWIQIGIYSGDIVFLFCFFPIYLNYIYLWVKFIWREKINTNGYRMKATHSFMRNHEKVECCTKILSSSCFSNDFWGWCVTCYWLLKNICEIYAIMQETYCE